MNQELIGTFNPGDKVICHDRLVEDMCPECGSYTGCDSRYLNQDVEGVIFASASGKTWWCSCGHDSIIPDGYYEVKVNGTIHFYPYTLLEKV